MCLRLLFGQVEVLTQHWQRRDPSESGVLAAVGRNGHPEQWRRQDLEEGGADASEFLDGSHTSYYATSCISRARLLNKGRVDNMKNQTFNFH